jgi:hypothetical protein
MAYYYDAVSFDPQLPEGNERLSILFSNISSGNIGENVRNDIQRRNEWKKILDEAEQFFRQHPPFEIIYDPSLTQGRVDYEKETVDLSFALQIRQTDGFKILENIRKGLIETGRMEEWGGRFSGWPIYHFGMSYTDYNMFGFASPNRNTRRDKVYRIEAIVLNEQDKQLSTGRGDISYELWFFPIPDSRGNYVEDEDTSRFSFRSYVETIKFEAINANDITDNLTIRIVSVNGVDAANNTDYIRILTMPIERR